MEKCEKESLSAVQKIKLDDFFVEVFGKCEKERLSAVQKITLDEFL